MLLSDTQEQYKSKAYEQYRQNSVFTATPEELTFMLYNGVIRFILRAQAAINEKKLDVASNSIIRAQDIILELENTLDMKYSISRNLYLLYDYINRRLVDANVKKDSAILDEVLGLARDLRDTWAQAMKLAKKQRVAVNGAELGDVR